MMSIVKQFGLQQIEQLPLINGMVCKLDRPDLLEKIKQVKGVLAVEEDVRFKLKPVIDEDNPYLGWGFNWWNQHHHQAEKQTIPWGIDRIGANKVWDKSRGKNVRMAVVDTGIDLDHPDLAENIKGGYNALEPARPPDDDNGHGSHVAGIIAAVDNGFGVIGAAPGVDLYAVKALNDSGEGSLSTIVKALHWCVSNNMDVVNLSVGSDKDSGVLRQAVTGVVRRGVVVVAAAGNDGTSQSVDYPAAYPEVVAVGATDQRDRLARYSSQGPELNVVAPGSSVFSTYMDGGYKRLSGTSMATPHVAGAVALLKQQGRYNPSKIMELLQQNAEPLQGLSVEEQGAGIIKVDRFFK